MYFDNDYLVGSSDIYGIKGNWPSSATNLWVKPVYHVSAIGAIKVVDVPGPCGELFENVDPRQFTRLSARPLPLQVTTESSPWGRMLAALVNIGISIDSIGMFGSRRLSLAKVQLNQWKDTDFVVYGRNYHDLLHARINEFHEMALTSPISEEHVEYQARTHGSHYDARYNTLEICLQNKWSSCMIKSGICSTIRFVDETILAPQMLPCRDAPGKVIDFSGRVQNAAGASFIPRCFTVLDGDKIIRVVTLAWIFHQCVKDGDIVSIRGILVEPDLVILDSYSHGIRHISN